MQATALMSLREVSLPKWPQMLVRGHSVTPQQAGEIIRRTDRFLVTGYGGNDSRYCRAVAAAVKMPWADFGESTAENHYARQEAWRAEWGVIETEYVHNTWISSSYIGGPYGWCHPDGTIQYADNVGKWPAAQDILDDWAKLAEAFPYLDLEALVCDAESSEDATPVLSILVRSGQATARGALEALPFFARYGTTPMEVGAMTPDPVQAFVAGMALPGNSREHGLPWETIRGWAR